MNYSKLLTLNLEAIIAQATISEKCATNCNLAEKSLKFAEDNFDASLLH